MIERRVKVRKYSSKVLYAFIGNIKRKQFSHAALGDTIASVSVMVQTAQLVVFI